MPLSRIKGAILVTVALLSPLGASYASSGSLLASPSPAQEQSFSSAEIVSARPLPIPHERIVAHDHAKMAARAAKDREVARARAKSTLNQAMVLIAEAKIQQQASWVHITHGSGGSSHGGCGRDLGCIKNRESRGEYGICNASGHCGAYQFAQGTWDTTTRYACSHGVAALCKDIGKNPATVSPSEQDVAAQQLMNNVPGGGPGHWATS